MHKAIHQIKKFKASIQLEQIYNYLIVTIIAVILSMSLIALLRPITPTQYHQVYKISHQTHYIETQEMALALLSQDQIRVGQYLKLMQALQIEQHQAKQLPPISSEER